MPTSILFLLLLLLMFIITTLTSPSSSATTESFVFGGCSPLKFSPASAYENNLNSLLTSIVNSAMFSSYNNFTIHASTPQDTLYGVFQCRGDISGTPGCSRCVARAVSQLGTLCPGACGGALQLEGCYVKYDNVTFLGVEDKTEVLKKCGPSIGLTYNDDALTRRDAVLANLGALDGGGLFRVASSGDFQGVAQCMGDLSVAQCQDCISDAIQRLRMECVAGAWGDLYLAKCYARYARRGNYSPPRTDDDDDSNRNDEEVEKTLAILIGLIAGVALLIVFLSCLSKVCGKQKGGK